MKNLFYCFSLMLLLNFITTLSFAEQKEKDAGLIHEIKAGLLKHDVKGLWSGHTREKGNDFNLEIVFNFLRCSLFSAYIYPNIGIIINDMGGTSRLYAGFIGELEYKNGIFICIGVGGALHNGNLKEFENFEMENKLLGSRLLFHIPFEIGYSISTSNRISLYFDHISNAYLAKPNEGMDTLGIRYGYRF